MYACTVITFSVGTPLALGSIALRAHRPYGLSYTHSPKGGAFRPSGSLLLFLVGEISAQCFIAELART